MSANKKMYALVGNFGFAPGQKGLSIYRYDEAYLKKVMIHATVEAQHLSKCLPELYAEYKDKPEDAD